MQPRKQTPKVLETGPAAAFLTDRIRRPRAVIFVLDGTKVSMHVPVGGDRGRIEGDSLSHPLDSV